MQNDITENKLESPAQKEKEHIKKSRIWNLLKMDEYFNKENLGNTLPFIFFLGFLVMVYISNNYYAEKTMRKKDKIKNELKELRSEYIFEKSKLMFGSIQSVVSDSVARMGIKESVVPPKKIIENKK